MPDSLFGKTLQWACWDNRNLLSALLHAHLNDWGKRQSVTTRLTRIADLAEYELVLTRRSVGLAVWALWEAEYAEAVCLSLAAICDQSSPPIRICFVAPEVAEHVGLLTEAGGQVVVSHLHRLPLVLPKILAACQLTERGSHPLTAGLIERLPLGTAEE